MLNAQRGFSLLETLLAMAIGSVLLLASARFLPGLQIALMQHTRLQTIEDDLWQRLRAVAKHLQRAGYCNGSCNGQPLFISAKGECVIRSGMPTAMVAGRVHPIMRRNKRPFACKTARWKRYAVRPPAPGEGGKKSPIPRRCTSGALA